MISTNDFQTGLTIELDGDLYKIVNYDHVKPGKGGAFVQTELKNLDTGSTITKRFRSGEKVNKAYIETKPYQFLYRSGDNYVFMDNETYEQINLSQDRLGQATEYLKENQEIKLELYEEEVIGVNIPDTVELAVADAPPAIRGNTVSGGSKVVTLETGAEVKVPLFIEAGDILKIDTRSGEYIERV
ncbi:MULTISPECIES: elongation factor P [unclassified Candidatus Frackibacter]|uniref:elongation factor P n=1 Tax=unclassified Candidatus Frackibacter TaxID=2648818 RepID=UPI0007938E91|nr:MULTISPECIES: elongation factor P [unclassified Candidatus Frackibacter]KXS45951.1 MAG: elongation factor P [Candidatus Frackibacter sp. T328-2]SDC03202.1 translation elongation factor P (EF-P) [Candidatus Frackibacter sp. WG11]SEM69165.1 translation elongation factor P (EF-P) [Candidatus Frackibacter sp. WG12]SFL80454.1 translation elongation factor P (EF-P) [Candidatus Frackibacter sp. WG13]